MNAPTQGQVRSAFERLLEREGLVNKEVDLGCGEPGAPQRERDQVLLLTPSLARGGIRELLERNRQPGSVVERAQRLECGPGVGIVQQKDEIQICCEPRVAVKHNRHPAHDEVPNLLRFEPGEDLFEVSHADDHSARAGGGFGCVVGVGQRANAVVRATQCPVLFARESPTGGILAASDLLDLQYPTLDAAQRIAQRRAARLCLFHAAGTRRGMTAARSRLRCEAPARGADAEVVTTPGDPLEAIVKQAKSMQAELLVIGSDVQRALPGGLSPLLSDQLIRRAPCSVLLVRKHKGPAARAV